MKVTLNWLKQYVGFNWSPEEATERHGVGDFTAGLRVERRKRIVRP